MVKHQENHKCEMLRNRVTFWLTIMNNEDGNVGNYCQINVSKVCLSSLWQHKSNKEDKYLFKISIHTKPTETLYI